jgi:hypothetical protein
MRNAITLLNVKANGTDIDIRTITDIVKLALKKKMIKKKEFKKILTITNYLTVKEVVNKKVCRSKELITVKLDIAKSVLIS